jgi:hypothetical protein
MPTLSHERLCLLVSGLCTENRIYSYPRDNSYLRSYVSREAELLAQQIWPEIIDSLPPTIAQPRITVSLTLVWLLPGFASTQKMLVRIVDIEGQFMDPATIPDHTVVLGGRAGSQAYHDPLLYLSARLFDDFRLCPRCQSSR